MVLLDDKHLCDTIIAGNTDLNKKNITEAHTWSYPLSTLVVQNTRSTQEKINYHKYYHSKNDKKDKV